MSTPAIDPAAVEFDADGLVPAVVQDAATGRVLMLGYMNRVALERTLVSGEVHFWSRSRKTLWRKGETSGNTLTVRGLSLDCDHDTVLVQAEPQGPTCHRETVSCFGDEDERPGRGFARLEDLWTVIASRAADRTEGSYTVRLIEGGVDEAARKVLEEAGEVAFAAKDHATGSGSDGRVAEEAADLVYHLMVLLAERGMDPATVLDELHRRAG